MLKGEISCVFQVRGTAYIALAEVIRSVGEGEASEQEGRIAMFNINSNSVEMFVEKNHQNRVTHICQTGTLLISVAADLSVYVWDILDAFSFYAIAASKAPVHAIIGLSQEANAVLLGQETTENDPLLQPGEEMLHRIYAMDFKTSEVLS